MKTAISIPDATFQRAERRARELGMSRSQLYAKAVERMLDAHDEEQITQQIDESLSDEQQDEEIAFLSRAATGLAEPHKTS